MQLAASQLDGFYGDDPEPSQFHKPAPGGGCDSFKDAPWVPPAGGKPIKVPSCIPDQLGQGPYRPSPVQYIPTIMDRLEAAQISWKLYNVNGPNDHTPGTGYEWATCPTFYECLSTTQKDHWVPSSDVIADAQAGNLPAYATVVPTAVNSQHNSDSMTTGDNWIGNVVSAIENGPDWSSTAIFITYDDCGCFYDHVAPPTSPRRLGVRVPMLIISPFARPGFTDSNVASTDSMLAFVEHMYGLAPLSENDANAYDYSNSFNVSQAPLKPVPMIQSRVPPSSLRWLREHPPKDDIT
jgi:phospholipase C